MAAKLTANVVLEHDGQIVTLLAGTDLPEWAEGEVGDHVLDRPAEPEPEPEGKPEGEQPKPGRR